MPRPTPVAAGLFIATFLAALPALGEGRLKRADSLIQRSVAEHRVFQTCLSLLPGEQEMMNAMWLRMAEDALEVLGMQPGTDVLAARLRATMEPGALLPAPEATYAELRGLCLADPEWRINLRLFVLIQLSNELELLF